MPISRLRVSNEDFLISSMIERCPKTMMLRELVKNAVESAQSAPKGGARVEIGSLTVDGARKLAIWNTGLGMDAEELYRMCDLASSIGKQNALDENFGMGAKVASLPSNHHGIRYRSCKGGRVNQVMIGKRDAIYGRLHQTDADGTTVDVLDVTAQAVADGRSVAIDWTEVVLLGHRPEQDTLMDPYDGNPKVWRGWIAQDLYMRFFRLPEDMTIILRNGHIAQGDQPFSAISERTEAFAAYEAVPVGEGITIHYFYDAIDPEAPKDFLSAKGAIQPAHASAALVYRDEIYDFRTPWSWMRDAPIYGISFGARNFSVYVELPDDFPLVPDGYRQFLRHKEQLQTQIAVREFAQLTLQNRPAWMLDLLQRMAPDSHHIDGLHDEIANLFRTLGVRRRFWQHRDPRTQAAMATQSASADKPAPTEDDGETVHYEVAPQIIPLRDPIDILQRGMGGKAVRFYPETHQIFIDPNYSAFMNMRAALQQAFARVDDQEAVRRVALTVTERTLTRRICRTLAFALAKRDIWRPDEVDQATSMYSLTLAVDDQAETYGLALKEATALLASLQKPLGADSPLVGA